MNKKILLVGCGSEIGSMLLSMNDFKKDGFVIDTVLTNFAQNSKKNVSDSMDAVFARLILSNPQIFDKANLNYKNQIIKIKNRKIKFYFGDIKNFKLSKIKKKFDATIIATSKKHISNKNLMKKFLKISKYVFGVAESKNLPSIYPNLLNVQTKIYGKKPKFIEDFKDKIFALGSCQSNGWQAQLRGLIGSFDNSNLKSFKMVGTELDIIHPDTPQGRLGTKSDKPRDQDARNNFRPSFSQAKISMNKIFPKIHKVHTVSLRTLITPPGYQIARFNFKYELKNSKRINQDTLINKLRAFSEKSPDILRISKGTLGSKAYEMLETAAVILADKEYIYYKEDPYFLNTSQNRVNNLCQVIMQAYVHNTRGYCRSVLNCLKSIIKNPKKNKKIHCWI